MRRAALHRLNDAGAALIALAALCDVAGALLAVPAWWPVVSYAAAGAGAALASIGILLHLLVTPVVHRARGRSALRLLATGVLLLAWLLRGHPEIAPDPPIIAAEVLVALLLTFVRYR